MLFPWNCTVTLNIDLENQEYQRIFVVVSVAIATMAFFLNMVHSMVILHQKLLNNIKNVIIMSFSICGQLSSVVIGWYIYRITAVHMDTDILSNYHVCYFVPSGFLLVTLFTSGSLVTLQVFQVHLEVSCRTNSEQRCRAMTLVMILVAWLEGIVISVLPAMGWNNWQGNCTIPHIWSNGYSTALCLLYFIHLIVIVVLLFNVCCAVCKKNGSISPATYDMGIETVSNGCDAQSSSVPLVPSKSSGLRKVLMGFVLYLFGTLPVVCYTAYVVLGESDDLCGSIVMTANFEVGSILLVVLHSAVLPLFYTFTEDDLAYATAQFVHMVCCPCNHRNAVAKDRFEQNQDLFTTETKPN